MRFDVLTLFPQMYTEVLSTSIVGRAITSDLISCHLHDIRAHTDDRNGRIDDRPFGGGPGMVMQCEPLWTAVAHAEAVDPRPVCRIMLTPQGEPLTQARVESLAALPRLLLIAGHYEGIDERVVQELDPLEISIGDFVVSGGELPTMMLIDAVTRLLPGALGHEDSALEDSFSQCGDLQQRLLDCPHFTRPRTWRGREVPHVLLSGDHGAVAQWRSEQMIERTRARRPDLFQQERSERIDPALRSGQQAR
jgi:tRNA (guanine37-N1)-methyltransferase